MYQVTKEVVELFRNRKYNESIQLFLTQNRCVFIYDKISHTKLVAQSYSLQNQLNNSSECVKLWKLRDDYVLENRDKPEEYKKEIDFVKNVWRLDDEIRAKFGRIDYFRKKIENKYKTVWLYRFMKKNKVI